MATKTTVYPIQEDTNVDVGATPVEVLVEDNATTVESTTQPTPVEIVSPNVVIHTAGVQGPPGPPTGNDTDIMKLEFVGKGVGSTKTTTIIVGTTTIAEAFGVGDEIYLQWILPIGVNRLIAPSLEGSFFPVGSEVGTTVSWQMDFLADIHGGDVGGTATVRYLTDVPLPDTENTALHGQLEFPNGTFLTEATDAVHIRIKRIASSNDPSAKVAIEHLDVHFSTEGKVGAAGTDGADGADGLGSVTTFYTTKTAGDNLAAYKIVRVDTDSVYYADKDIASHAGKILGITTETITAGNPINVQTGGELTNGAWAWVAGAIYLGSAGALTQTAPTVGILQKIGVALNATTILIDIDDPVIRI